LIGAPLMSFLSSGTMAMPSSRGCPVPPNTLPRISRETPNFMVSPVKRTEVSLTSMPLVPSKTWMTALLSWTSRTWPCRTSPVPVLIFTNSPKKTSSTPSTTINAPEASMTLL